jgi:hypothetical protein
LELIPENLPDRPLENPEIYKINWIHQYDSENLASFWLRLPDFDFFSSVDQFPRPWK